MRIFVMVLALFSGGALFAIWYLQEQFIFPGSVLPPEYHFRPGKMAFSERSVLIDGVKIHSLHFKPMHAKNLILFFHGNAGHLGSWSEVAEAVAQQTRSEVWMMDYPGYGLSAGRIESEQQLQNVAAEFFRQAKIEAEASRLKLFLWGRSIGSGLAAKLAAAPKAAATKAEGTEVSGVILETPYYGLERAVKDLAWWAPLWLLKYRIRTFEVLPQIKCPVLLLHGDADLVINVQHSKDLAPLNPANAKLVVIPGGHHNDLASYPEYWRAVEEFVH